MPGRPVVAVDIDEVLSPLVKKFMVHHNEVYGTDIKFEQLKNYYLSTVTGDTMAEEISKLDKYYETSDHMNTIEPSEGAFESLELLKQKYDLVVVTARRDTFADITQRWVQRHFPGVFKKIYYGNHHGSTQKLAVPKSQLCREAGAEILIDDNVSYAQECSEQGIKVLLFGDYPWSQTGNLHPLVTPVKSWADVVTTLM